MFSIFFACKMYKCNFKNALSVWVHQTMKIDVTDETCKRKHQTTTFTKQCCVNALIKAKQTKTKNLLFCQLGIRAFYKYDKVFISICHLSTADEMRITFYFIGVHIFQPFTILTNVETFHWIWVFLFLQYINVYLLRPSYLITLLD